MKELILIHPITHKEIKIQAESDPIEERFIYLDEETLLKDLEDKLNKIKLSETDKNLLITYITEINKVERIDTKQHIGVLTSVVYLKVPDELKKKIKHLFLKGGITI
jgi:hypothetical protein